MVDRMRIGVCCCGGAFTGTGDGSHVAARAEPYSWLAAVVPVAPRRRLRACAVGQLHRQQQASRSTPAGVMKRDRRSHRRRTAPRRRRPAGRASSQPLAQRGGWA